MKVNLRKLSTKDLATLSEQVFEVVNQSNVSEAKKHVLLKRLEATHKDYVLSLSKATYSGKGKTVSQAHKERSAAYRNLKSFLTGYSKLPSAPFHKEAKELFAIFKQLGLRIDKLSYSEQTAQINKLIELFDTPENAEKLQKLSLNEAFDDIKKTQQNFKSLYSEQISANTELREQKSASVIRKDLEDLLKRFLSQVTIMYDVESWTPLYNKLNEYIKTYKKTINLSETTKEK